MRETKKVFRTVWLACFAVLAASSHSAQNPDKRLRTFVSPVRVVAAADTLRNAESLLAPRYGQIPEGRFLSGSGITLARGEWVIVDFGRELHGSLQIGSGGRSGRESVRVRVRFGESVSETMSELKGTAQGATATNDHAIRDDVVLLPWAGRREIGETGFRFVRIDNVSDSPVQLDYVRAVSLTRPMRRIGGFRCSDERLNRIFETAVDTVHLCCQDFIWDGIKRDRLVWMGDTHPETMAILNVFGSSEIVPATLDYAAAITAPASAWMNNMATYTLWWVRNVAEWYRYTGDHGYLEKHRRYLVDTVDRIQSTVDDRGFWKADTFLDWPTQSNRPASAAGTQGLLLMAMDDAAFLLDELGGVSGEVKKNLDAARKRVASTRPDPLGAKTAAAMLALSGLRDAKEMFALSLGKNGHNGVSTFYGYYMIEAMSAAGETRRALDTVRDYWGGMLDMGATSFWEDFNLAWTNNAFRIDSMPVAGKKDVHGDFGDYCYVGFRHSLCHGWSAGPASWCINRVLGIRPLDVGCRTVEVNPSLGDLKWAEGAMALPGGGKVSVRAERTADGEVKTIVNAPDWVKIVKGGR